MTSAGESGLNAAAPYTGARVWLGGHDTAARGVVECRLAGALRPPTGPIDAAFITPMSIEEATHFAGKLLDRLNPNGTLTVVYRRASDGLGGGTPASADPLRKAMDGAGFQLLGRSPFEEEWVSARFSPAREVRP